MYRLGYDANFTILLMSYYGFLVEFYIFCLIGVIGALFPVGLFALSTVFVCCLLLLEVDIVIELELCKVCLLLVEAVFAVVIDGFIC